MSAAGKRRRASLKPICYIDMTAFLSIQLVLLFTFIFAVSSNWHDLPSNTTDNPKAYHPIAMRGANREDAMIVAIQRDGKVWLGYERMNEFDELTTMIRKAVKRGAERKVYINADGRAKYSQVREVLGAIRAAGIEDVAFLVWERNPYSVH